MPDASTLLPEDLIYCTQLVREQAIDFYLADLLLPDVQRSAALVLHAFHVEITNITLGTNEPLVGEIRLQWWMDVLSDEREGEAHGNPLARALLAVVAEHDLPVIALQAKLDAHIFDLYRNPMESRTMLEGWCGETRSVLFQLIAMAGGTEPGTALADACGHAGVATGITGVLENAAMHRVKGQLYVPADLLAAAGTDGAQFLTETGDAHDAVFKGMIDLAREHFDKASEKVSAFNKESSATFLPLALVPLYLNRAEKQIRRISTGLSPVPQWRKQWTLWRAS